MVPTAIAAELTGALRDFGTGVEVQTRALGSSVRHLASAAGVTEASRARVARELQVPPVHLLGWLASALDLATSRVVADPVAVRRDGQRTDHAIVDRSLTRC